MKVPFGTISLEGLGEGSVIDINYDYSRHELVVTGKCQVRFQALMDDIIETMREGLANNSIYKGQALEISDVNDPKVMDLSGIDKQLMVLSDKTEYALRPIYARINNPERCIKKGIPLKFGALLEGGYGTGKTLLAFKLARMAVNKGWVFIYLKNPSELAESIRMARTIDRSGHGCIIFTEDIDQVTRGNRDAAMQDILNTLDGGDTKDMNVISLFTTNHIELIEPTFLRGKRIGTIISMGDLDAKTAEIFIRRSFEDGDYVIKDDLTDVCQFISENHIAPAFMAEIIEKVKAIMVLDDQVEVKASDLRNSVESYLDQVRLAQTKDMSESISDKFYNAFKEMMNGGPLAENVQHMAKAMKDNWDEDFPVK
jgi:transitional endoplasmic reticulum ATPase